jgi:hypothetical protein
VAKTASEKIVKIDDVAEHLSKGDSILQVSRKTKMSPATVRAIADTKACQEIVEDLVRRRRENTFRKLEVLASRALLTHMEIMEDKKHRDRLAAAESVLDRAGFGKVSKIEKDVKGTIKQIVRDDFDGRPIDELEFYAANGHFPEDGDK